MTFYIIAIIIAILGSAGLGFGEAMPLFSLTLQESLLMFFTPIIWIACVDVFITVCAHLIPQKFLRSEGFLFKEREFEKNFYAILRIKVWKDKVPELGKLSNFKKDKLYDAKNPAYLKEFIMQGCRAELLHIFSALSGFFALFFFPLKYSPYFALFTVLAHFLLHLPPALIQRYNRPRLERLLKSTLSRRAVTPESPVPAAERVRIQRNL